MEPTELRESVGHLVQEKKLSVSKACRITGLSRSSWYQQPQNQKDRDHTIIEALNEVVNKHRRWGFWKCDHRLRNQGHHWNQKRVDRVSCAMKLNLPRRTKKRVPRREAQPLEVISLPNKMWSMDFVHDSLYRGRGRCFRTLNINDEGVREALAIEVDTSLPALRVIRVLEQLKERRGLPEQIRVDNGPEFISQKLVDWCEKQGVKLCYIQPGKPTQNAFIERFNRTFRTEVLDAHLFDDLEAVRDLSWKWMISCNEERPHESLNNLTPSQYSNLKLSA